ncbi:MAG: WXG100 family type VII secretion target [Lachnospiraceae bacterium]|nr:WXG100 family type VII secretion target [Lachnospiraceae bacterium]
MTGNLLVTPEKLISTASQFADNGSEVNNITMRMIEIIQELGYTWAGEAYTAYFSKINALNDDMARIYSMIREHSNDLQEMARNYQQAEATNIESSSALNADVIS